MPKSSNIKIIQDKDETYIVYITFENGNWSTKTGVHRDDITKVIESLIGTHFHPLTEEEQEERWIHLKQT